VLIPERPGLRELDELAPEDVHALTGEILHAGAAVRAVGQALDRPVEKLNLGALGNIVAQLHVHVVGRRADDPAWPGPVWGFGEPEPYDDARLAAALAAARGVFGEALRP
jgi:diadenosine tetraphosphate (Ap4A) HIT family hydrolase